MTDELRADPVELATLAGSTLRIGKDLRTASAEGRAEAQLPSVVFGNSGDAPECERYHSDVLEAADRALSTLADVFEADADRLLLTAFAYKSTDEAEARRQEAACRCGERTPL
ncbi:hypothetical protein AB0I28_28080 [Phytomonospora sp. NPDC050363]|uniref:hypothetical protein n=1 Tax=Phytomonospora sp. NPDC050363 TaxID=3155642 RepID=UPI0033E7F001